MCKIFIHVRLSHEGFTITTSSLIKILSHVTTFSFSQDRKYKKRVLISKNIHRQEKPRNRMIFHKILRRIVSLFLITLKGCAFVCFRLLVWFDLDWIGFLKKKY